MISNNKDIVDNIKSSVNDTFGVYKFFDDQKNLLYIGKSKTLKKRMLSYFQNLKNHESRIRQMVSQVSHFEIIETADELTSLLLEDALIKKGNPQVNLRQNKYQRNKYLKISNDEQPVFEVVDMNNTNENSSFIGPFKDEYYTADILDIASKYFGIGKNSLVNNSLTNMEYNKKLDQAVSFLNGDFSHLETLLLSEMYESSKKLNFERADRIKQDYQFCKRYTERKIFLEKFVSETILVTDKSGKLEYKFENGNVLSLPKKNRKNLTKLINYDLVKFKKHEYKSILWDRGLLVFANVSNL